MKKSRKVALFGILLPAVFFVLLLALMVLLCALLFSGWNIPYYRAASIADFLIFLLMLVFTGGCIAYAVVVLRQSRRAWTGYLAAVGGLAIAVFVGFALVSNFLNKQDVKAADTIPPLQFEEFLQHPRSGNNKRAVDRVLRRKEFTAEMLYRVAEAALAEWPNRRNMAWRKIGLISRHSNVNVQTLILLAETPNPHVQMFAASHAKTPMEILKKLRLEKHPGIDRALAQNSSASVELLRDLANSPERTVRYDVARNHNTPTEVLQKLSLEKNVEINRVLAKNPNTPARVLHDLLNSPDVYTREHAAGNPNTVNSQ